MSDIFARLSEIGVVPVITIEDAAAAVALADALAEGGIPTAEITFRTHAAADCIRRIHEERPDFLVGAGTVLTEAELAEAQAAGALYALAPGYDAVVVEEARRLGMPFAPGVMTPSEVQAALRAGVGLVKFFPASLGGPKLLASIAAPFALSGIGFIPTGGVTQANIADWMENPAIRAVGGTWIATRDDIAEGRWGEITKKARAAVDEVARIRAD